VLQIAQNTQGVPWNGSEPIKVPPAKRVREVFLAYFHFALNPSILGGMHNHMLFWNFSEVWNYFDFLFSLIDQKFLLEYSIAAVMRVSADLRSPSTSNMAREPHGPY